MVYADGGCMSMECRMQNAFTLLVGSDNSGQWHSDHVRSSDRQVQVLMLKLQAPFRNMSDRAASSKQHQLGFGGWWLGGGC